MSNLFHGILVWLYNTLPGHDLGLAIIVFTLAIKLILSPLSVKMFKSQKAMSAIQPKIKELQEKHKGDKTAFAQAQMGLFKEHNVNPLGGCLPVLIQLPIIWVLYRVFINILQDASLNPVAFGVINLAHPNHALAIATGIAQGVQSWISLKIQKQQSAGGADNPALKMSQNMMYFFPVMIVFISWSLPSGLVLYWLVSTLWSVLEQIYIRRRHA